MDTQYLGIAIQYYLAGRSATFMSALPVAGNLFHHAVEMLLKFVLIKNSYTPDQLKKSFGHDLKKLWSAVKSKLNDPTMDKFDQLVSDLNDFEDLRYPGRGYAASISIYKCEWPKVFNGPMEIKQHQVVVEEIDEFVSALLTGKVTSEWIKGIMMGEALEQYKRDNKHPFF